MTEQPLSVIFKMYFHPAKRVFADGFDLRERVNMKILKFLTVFVAVLSITFSVPASVLAAPGQPSPQYPTNGQLIYPPFGVGTFTYQWSSSGALNTVYYDMEVSTDPTFTNVAAYVDSNDANHTASKCATANQLPQFTNAHALTATKTYYLRLQAYDTTCNGDFATGGSGWAVYTFYTAIPAPTLIAPANGSTLSNNLNNNLSTPPGLFQWSSVTGASGYVLQATSDATFNSINVLNVNVTNNYYTPTSDLPAHTLIYWRVETLASSYGPSAWSTTCAGSGCSFTTANTSAAPVPLQTGTSKVTNDFSPGLRWKEIDLPAGATFSTYEVQGTMDPTFKDGTYGCFDVRSTSSLALAYLAYQTFNNDPDFTYAQMDTQDALAVGPIGANCLTEPKSGGGTEFQPTQDYFWRVRAWFNASSQSSDWSIVYKFSTSYPKVTAGFATTGNSADATIKFSWTDITPKPYYYWVQVCFEPSFGHCVASQKPVDNPFIWRIPAVSNLPSGETLYWRVLAGGTWGQSLWSATQTTTVP